MTAGRAMEAGKELDALVAQKVMGFRCIVWDGDNLGWYAQDLGDHFNPSQDIADAWMVVEKLRDRGYWVELSLGPSSVQVDIRTHEHEYVLGESGATAPLAMCRAALALQAVAG